MFDFFSDRDRKMAGPRANVSSARASVRSVRSPNAAEVAYVRALAGVVASPGLNIRMHGNSTVVCLATWDGGLPVKRAG